MLHLPVSFHVLRIGLDLDRTRGPEVAGEHGANVHYRSQSQHTAARVHKSRVQVVARGVDKEPVAIKRYLKPLFQREICSHDSFDKR